MCFTIALLKNTRLGWKDNHYSISRAMINFCSKCYIILGPLNVVILDFIMLSVIMLNVVMLRHILLGVMLSVIMLIVF
jgi:hypothetical protein